MLARFLSMFRPGRQKQQQLEQLEEENRQLRAELSAINRSMAVIHFSAQGDVLDANDSFIKTMQYSSLHDIKGRNHKLFCDPQLVSSARYVSIWQKLRNGEYFNGVVKRVDAKGNPIWLQAT